MSYNTRILFPPNVLANLAANWPPFARELAPTKRGGPPQAGGAGATVPRGGPRDPLRAGVARGGRLECAGGAGRQAGGGGRRGEPAPRVDGVDRRRHGARRRPPRGA
eukprot:8630486-Pyramimonas_sp.AAC.1